MPKTYSLFLSVCLLFLLTPLTARSEDVRIGSDLIQIPIPEGYCPLDATEPSDNRFIEFLKEANENVNELLLAFADCTQLLSWRNGELPDLNDFGYVLTPSLYVNDKREMDFDRFLSEMLDVFKNMGIQVVLEDAMENAEAILSRHAISIKLNEMKNLGILQQDDKALYLGLLLNVQTEEGKSKKLVGVYSVTLLNGKFVSQYLWKKYQGDQTVSDLEDLTSSWVSDTHSANLEK